MLDLSSLNERQLEAVTYESGNLLVLAGPGSGKTHVIIQRLFFLLEIKKVPPEQILVISFTNDSAKEMQQRFLKLSNLYFPVVFGTFHSVFYYIVRESSDSHISIINSTTKLKVFGNIIKDKLSVNSDLCNYSSENVYDASMLKNLSERFIQAVSYYKNTLDSEKSVKMLPEKYMQLFEPVYCAYEEYRKKNNYIDFDDMVMDCYSIIKTSKNARDKWTGRFSHILIDEFQDINPVQFETVKLLLGDKGVLFAVGDDDQSIYNFRGAEPECLKRAIRECGCATVNLERNYRNPEEIRHFSEVLIMENASRINKKSISKMADDGTAHIEVRGYETKELHYEMMAELVESNVDKQFAVLFRTNIEMQRFAIILSKKGIRYICREKKKNIYDHFIIKDIMSYLRLAYIGINREDFARIVNKPVRFINREALIGSEAVFENISNYYNSDLRNNFSKKIINNANILKKDLSFIGERHLFTAVNYILNKIGYKKYILDKAEDAGRLAEYERIIDFFLEDIKNMMHLKITLRLSQIILRKMMMNHVI